MRNNVVKKTSLFIYVINFSRQIFVSDRMNEEFKDDQTVQHFYIYLILLYQILTFFCLVPKYMI